MTTVAANLPEQGQLVDVRQRRWVVNDVAKSTLPASPLRPLQKPQHLVTLSSVEDDALGEELQVVWELELGTHVHDKVDLPEPTGFDPPARLDAFLDAVRWGAASTADIHNIQAPFRSGIEVHDYQLDPVVRAIQMPRVSLLIADDVGLGKTIEAGLVGLELIIRHRARKVLIVCPASLQIQWRDQMRDKFRLDFRIVDSELLRTPEETALLREMKAWAASASARPDSKTAELIRWLHATVKPGGKWANERVILFTEYRATQNWLQTVLASEGFTGGDRLMTLYGGMDKDERERVKAAFQYDPAASPVRILLATDAASEGIDLQNHCHRLVHCEIPWNPNRLEQRNGRIDRHGQRAKEVLVYHFVGKGYKDRERGLGTPPSELEADLEFLMRASIKVNNIREDLGKVGPVIAEQVEEAMLGRRTALHTEKAEKEAEPVRKMLKFERDLQAQIARLRDQFFHTRKELRLTPDNIQAVVEVALKLSGQPPLVPTEVAGIWPDPSKRRTVCPVFNLPALKGTWALCSQGLNHPHTGEQRPLVFDHDLTVSRDDVVVAHLNHRLVQMSLRLLREEVWSREGRKKLHRVAARLVPSHALEAPAMIAHARLVVIGGDSHRLHEEIVTAGGLIREGRFSRMNVGQVHDALSAALAAEPAEGVKQRLVELWPKHSASLIQALEARMKDRTTGLQRELAERAKKEEGDIRAILTELLKTIQAELHEPEYVQLDLFSDPEREQFERNVDALKARVKQIPEEIERETAAIRERFADPQPRLFPVAVTYLVPEKLAGT